MEKEKFDLDNFPTSNSAKKMLSYVTDGFYDKSYVGKWLYQVMGIEYDEAQELAEALPEQFFPETATWGLMWHERKWNLPVRENLSYQERRRLIYQKRDYRAPMTPYRMETYLEDATGFKVRIADVNDPGDYGFVAPHPNVFKAYFIGDGTLDSKKVHEILNRLKQSHTTYGVSERIETVLDNRELEQIILRNIRFKMQVPFWYEYVYDGTWLLDGSVILGVKRRYGLVLGLKYNQGRFYTPEQIRLISVEFATQINNSELFYAGVRHSFGINFWDVRCFNGSWNLDGSVLLDAKRRYGLSLGIHHKHGITNETENIRLQNFKIGWKQRIEESVKARVIYNFASGFWRVAYLNGDFLLNGERLLNACRYKAKAALTVRSDIDMSETETVANVIVETKTRDYWFLDGAQSLDGSRNLNSIYRKEVAE